MNILILGASGFLGGKVYEKLILQNNHEVLGTCFKSKNNSKFKQLNISNESEVRTVFNEFKPNIVVWCLLNMNNERELTDLGLHNAVKNIENYTKLIYISTDGFVEGKGNYSEDFILEHYSLNNPIAGYVNAKIDGENIVRKNEKNVVVRTGPLYGQDVQGNWDKRITDLINSLSQNQSICRWSNIYKTFVHVEDLSDLICEVIEENYKGIIHAGPETKESYYTFNRKIARKLKLNEALINEDIIDEEYAEINGIPLDTSMNTEKCRKLFTTSFRNM